MVWFSLHKFTNTQDESKQIPLSVSIPMLPLHMIKVYLFIKSHKISTIHVHSIARYGFLVLFACIFTKTKLIISPWGSDLVEGSKSFLNKFFIRYLIKRASLIHVDAAHMSNICEELVPHSKEKCKHIMFGANTDLFKNKSIASSSKFSFLSIRNHEDIYMVDLIIKAFAIISKEFENLNLNILGSGSKTEDLKKLASQYQLPESINFIGRVTQEEMIEEINRNKVVISASIRDGGLASSLGEAMSCERVVIASSGKEDENLLWIDHGVNGYLFANKSIEDLVERMRQCFKNQDLNKEIGLRARQTILKRYDFEVEMLKFEEIYNEFIASKA